MIEVLWHGRGGQGAFTAARLLGAAASLEGAAHALAFPSFGPERRGAPVRAFTRFGPDPIGDRSAITAADFVVYLDETLLSDGWADELKPTGLVLVNTAELFDDPRLWSIDANRISAEILGRPLPNTAMLGALSVLCPDIEYAALEAALNQYMPARHRQGNQAVLAEAARMMEQQKADRASQVAASTTAAAIEPAQAAEPTSSEAPRTHFAGIAPFIIQPAPANPAEYARTTCFAAPHIVKDNAGWRIERPLFDVARCTGCERCWEYCPDAAIEMRPRTAADGAPNERAAQRPAPQLDELFCKGCGICARLCPADAITMVPEAEAAALQRHEGAAEVLETPASGIDASGKAPASGNDPTPAKERP